MNRSLFFILLIIVSMSACTKPAIDDDDDFPVITCDNTGALNYAQEGYCEYAIDDIEGTYMVAVTQYDLQPGIEGDSFVMEVRDSYCPNFPDYNTSAEIVSLNGSYFYPTSFCIQLNKYATTFDGNQTLWALAQLTGNASFAGGKFTFDGLVTNSDSSYRIKLRSSSFHRKDP